MARKPIYRDLPPLLELLPDWQPLPAAANHSAAIVLHLRQLVRAVRQPRPRPFYAQRELAAFFSVPLRTVARAVKTLETDGLLTCLRGSKTLVAGRAGRPRATVRGVVGLPVWLPAFQQSAEWAEFYMELEQQLRRYHFVADFIFFSDRDDPVQQTTAALLDHNLDLVIWFMPDFRTRPQIQVLTDNGIRVFTVSDGKIPFAERHYWVDFASAYRAVVRDWKKRGFTTLAVAARNQRLDLHHYRLLEQALRHEQWQPKLIAIQTTEPAELRRRLVTARAAALVLPQRDSYQRLCEREPAIMQQVFAKYPVLLLEGRIRIDYFRGRNVCADLIMPDYAALARRIARDLHSGRLFTQPTPVVCPVESLRAVQLVK